MQLKGKMAQLTLALDRAVQDSQNSKATMGTRNNVISGQSYHTNGSQTTQPEL